MLKNDIKGKLTAFTLAEVLITMVIIVILTIMSVPVIKKITQTREQQDKNWWYCTLDDYNGKATGSSSLSSTFEKTNTYCKFIPPQGIKRFNVTVVGGGGGGASGEAGRGTARVYFPETTDKTFVPVRTADYQVIAIGGGGGGGGGGSLGGRGRGGGSGAVIMTNVRLQKDSIYNVAVGYGGGGGKGDNFLNIGELFDIFAGSITSGLVTSGVLDIFGDIVGVIFPSSKWDGGGRGTGSGINGPGVTLKAEGGYGGSFRHLGWCKKWIVKYPCKKWSGGLSHERAAGYSGGTGAVGRLNNGSDGGVVCSGSSCLMPNLYDNLEGDVSLYGKGGRGGANGHGHSGTAGYVQIKDIPVYGGGGGQAGAVSFYSYERSPLDKSNTVGYVEVYPGYGGAGQTQLSRKGHDGQVSRFGNRIVADGGKGGDIQKTAADSSTLKASGEDGAVTSVPENVLNLISELSSLKQQTYGGYTSNNSAIDGKGYNKTSFKTVPGTGGAGGGAQGTKSFSTGEIQFGKGGNGAAGVIIVTW